MLNFFSKHAKKIFRNSTGSKYKRCFNKIVFFRRTESWGIQGGAKYVREMTLFWESSQKQLRGFENRIWDVYKDVHE